MEAVETTRAITWEAPEHHHIEKSGDWFWVLGIIALSGALAAFFFGNFLLAVLILVGAFAMALIAVNKPQIIAFSVSTRAVRVGEKIYPYSTLESYFIDEENSTGPQLLLKSKRFYDQLIIMPIPEEYVDDIEDLLIDRLPEEELEEPLATKILEIFGF